MRISLVGFCFCLKEGSYLVCAYWAYFGGCFGILKKLRHFVL